MFKLNEEINFDGIITTINELDKQGKITYQKREMESKRTASSISVRYFAEIKDTNYSCEITKYAYVSKTKEKEVPVYVDGVLITKEAINAYNRKIEVSFNDNWNKDKGIGSLKERSILTKIGNYFYSHKLNFTDVIRYKEIKHLD